MRYKRGVELDGQSLLCRHEILLLAQLRFRREELHARDRVPEREPRFERIRIHLSEGGDDADFARRHDDEWSDLDEDAQSDQCRDAGLERLLGKPEHLRRRRAMMVMMTRARRARDAVRRGAVERW